MTWWKDPNTQLFSRDYEEISEEVKKDLDKSELVLLFFGSYTNRPSRLLTHFLSQFYQEVRKVYGSRLQVIFVPMDDSEKDTQDFVKALHGNWLVIPWHQQGIRRNVRNAYNVINFPWITVVKNSPEAPIVTQEGKEDIQELGLDSFPKWVMLAKNAKTKASVTSDAL